MARSALGMDLARDEDMDGDLDWVRAAIWHACVSKVGF